MANPITRFFRTAPTSQKLALGGVGAIAAAALLVGGAGAAFNSYQDSHKSTGNVANGSEVVLELSTDGVAFDQSDVAAGDIDGLEADDSRSVSVWLKNAGTEQITLDQDGITTEGAAFDGTLGANPDTVALDADYVGTTIEPDQTVKVTVNVAAPAGQDAALYAGATGTWSVDFSAVNSTHYVEAAD